MKGSIKMNRDKRSPERRAQMAENAAKAAKVACMKPEARRMLLDRKARGQRDEKIIALRLAGKTLNEIAQIFDISRGRVAQLIQRTERRVT